jgi:hypothetical protein
MGNRRIEIPFSFSEANGKLRSGIFVKGSQVETAREFSVLSHGACYPLRLTFPPSLASMKHEDIRWNRINGEWFCAKCGRTSERMRKEEAQAELEKYECNLSAADPKSSG